MTETTPRDALDSIWAEIAQVMRRPCDETETLFDNLCQIRDSIEDGFTQYRLALGRVQQAELDELRRQAAALK